MATPNVRGAYELLRRAMQQQSLQQQGSEFCSTPNAALEVSSDSYGSPQGGLLGRLLALQAEQSRQQPFAGNNGPTSSEALDPNFRHLSRAPVVARPQGAIGPSNRPDDQSSLAYSPFRGGPSLDLPSMSPGPLPQIPMQAIPDWWKAAGQILQLDPTTWSGKGGGGNDNYCRYRARA